MLKSENTTLVREVLQLIGACLYQLVYIGKPHIYEAYFRTLTFDSEKTRKVQNMIHTSFCYGKNSQQLPENRFLISFRMCENFSGEVISLK